MSGSTQVQCETTIAASVEEVWTNVQDSTLLPHWMPNVHHTVITTAQSKAVGEIRQCEVSISGRSGQLVELFEQYYPPLKSYLYRMTASEQDAEDIASETFERVMHKYESFEGRASIKTWIFTIATNLARDHFRAQKRWPVNAQDQAKRVASVQALKDDLQNLERSNPEVKYEIKEHIDFCFTCMMKTLPLEQQIVLMLKNIYGFKVEEIKIIVNKSEASVKNLLHQARKTLTEIFESRCSLVSQKGVCYQCSELNGILNPKQSAQEVLVKLKMVQQARKNPTDQDRLLDLRLKLIREIDPCQGKSAALHLSHMRMLRRAIQDDEAMAVNKRTI